MCIRDSSEGPRNLSAVPQKAADTASLLQTIRDGLAGQMLPFRGPFGRDVPMVYADWTASGRGLEFIENYIQTQVMPVYGNTHTTTSISGHQSTCFRSEARQIIAECCNAKVTGRGAEDVVLFAGSGSTAAVSVVVNVLGLNVPLPPGTAKPVVFVGPFEHHSNLLPWRESCADVISIGEDPTTGQVDMAHLEKALKKFASRPLKVGSFSAASNVTGVLADTNAISALLHRHGALAFWDYATAAPYAKVDMNPVVLDEDRPFVYKDAVFISGHKFVGGPGTPGVLLAKKRMFANAVPSVPGGGTVFYVSENDHRYLSNREEREEGGTPDVLGAVRAGLCFQLKHRVGVSTIEQMETALTQRVLERFSKNPRITVLGPSAPGVPEAGGAVLTPRLPVVAFMVRWRSRFLHYNFVCSLLNDLFGVQSRGGCQCAGPYGLRLLGISPSESRLIEGALLDKLEVLRPGFCRVSFPYFMSDEDVTYILDAMDFVADHGWRFLPLYKFNHKTGEWKHTSRFTKFTERKWLSDWDFMSAPATSTAVYPEKSEFLKQTMAAARELSASFGTASKAQETVDAAALLGPTGEPLRWFVYPSEALSALRSNVVVAEADWGELAGPMHPRVYDGAGSLWDDELPDLNQLEELEQPAAAAAAAAALPQEAVAPASGTMEAPPSTKYPTRSMGTKGPTGPTFLQPTAAAAIATATANTKKAILRPKIPPKLKRGVGQAIQDWRMIEPGDKLLLGLSGGKDSLTLLHILMDIQKRSPVKFELAAATVDPQTPSFDPSSMIEYCKALGITYHYLSEPIIERAKTEMEGDSLCAFCARMKRGLLYSCCRRGGYTKLVLAQHLDDLVESFFMSCYHGQTRTMKANYQADEVAGLRVIRPLIYTRETVTRDFAYGTRLPVINENCPACFEEPKERHRVKKMLAKEESLYPQLFSNMRRTLLPLMDEDSYTFLEKKREEILGRGEVDRKRRRKLEGEQSAKKPKTQAASEGPVEGAVGEGEAPIVVTDLGGVG
eukprot:TRINITY_DN4108_c0_g1_i1.p1 TRINITY_DN4108_c0_g1~~TRINITY_DN4108_c0_g1_i1.p1  ORF type:complete len:1013 (+),score=253.27 TRINITY_DN4108_c0_g1_i1:135-3173(+)